MHLALYRKYRSRTFDDVCGQEHITSVLKYEAGHNLISHAYLFCGPRGVGKTSCAKILAKAVNCEHSVDGNPCCECSACLSIDSGASVDVLELDAASNNRVDDMRELIDGVVYTPARLKYRVYIVDEAHMLSMSAFNAFLKTLEEPPSHVIFILATTELHKLPETIISRCQRFDFRRLTVPVIADRLEYIAKNENIKYTRGGLEDIAQLAGGGMRDAIGLLELCASRRLEVNSELVHEALGIASYDEAASVARAIASADYDAIFSTIDNIVASGRDIAVFWDELSSFFRDMLIYKTAKNPAGFLELSSHSLDILAKTASLFTLSGLLYRCSILDDAASRILRFSASARLTAELALVRMCDPSLSPDIGALTERVAALEEKLASLSPSLLSLSQHTPPAEPMPKETLAGSITTKNNPDNNSGTTDTPSTKQNNIVKLNSNKPSAAAQATSRSDAEKENARTGTHTDTPRPLPYWSELCAALSNKIPAFKAFAPVLRGYYASDGGFIISGSTSLSTEYAKRVSEQLRSQLSIFEGRDVGAEMIKFTVGVADTKDSNNKSKKSNHHPIDELVDGEQ